MKITIFQGLKNNSTGYEFYFYCCDESNYRYLIVIMGDMKQGIKWLMDIFDFQNYKFDNIGNYILS